MAELHLPGEAILGAVDKAVLDVMAKHFERVDDFATRLDVILLPHAPTGSIEANEIGDPVRAYGYDQARTALRASQDHLYAWRHLLLMAQLMPMYAHFSLLRTAHEAALTAYWLVEPGLTPDDRLARGVAAQAADYEEKKKIEVVGKLQKPLPPAKLAAERITDLIMEAGKRGLTKHNRNGVEILAVTVPGTVDLFNKYETTSGSAPGEILYRLYSGYAHAKQWALILGAERKTPFDSDGRAIALNQPDERIAAMATIAVIDAVDRALGAYEALRR